MGSNLSPLLDEIFLFDLEKKIVQYHSFDKVIFYYRYVDDTSILFNCTLSELNECFEYLNSLHPFISFAMDIEVNNSLPFLDLMITKSLERSIESLLTLIV